LTRTFKAKSPQKPVSVVRNGCSEAVAIVWHGEKGKANAAVWIGIRTRHVHHDCCRQSGVIVEWKYVAGRWLSVTHQLHVIGWGEARSPD
jgi:hypothetical protein